MNLEEEILNIIQELEDDKTLVADKLIATALEIESFFELCDMAMTLSKSAKNICYTE